jgi:hypothetical protein
LRHFLCASTAGIVALATVALAPRATPRTSAPTTTEVEPVQRRRDEVAAWQTLLSFENQRLPKKKPPSACSQGTAYRNCPACGKTTSGPHQKLNVLKNRNVAVTDPQKITVQEVRDPANDSVFTTDRKVWVTGFVASIDDGGNQETCNCKRPDLRDVHINIVADPSEANDKTQYVVVEFTPRWEKRFNFDDSDYPAMKQAVISQIGGKWVKFEGYLLTDWVHKADAKNTAKPNTPTCQDDGNDPSPCVWRAATWEVHPVTKYAVVPGP